MTSTTQASQNLSDSIKNTAPAPATTNANPTLYEQIKESITSAAEYASESVHQLQASLSGQLNQEIAKDDSVPIADRAQSAFHAAGSKISEQMHSLQATDAKTDATASKDGALAQARASVNDAVQMGQQAVDETVSAGATRVEGAKETIKDTASYVKEKSMAEEAAASRQANEKIVNDANAPLADRAQALVSSAGDMIAEYSHSAKAEGYGKKLDEKDT